MEVAAEEAAETVINLETKVMVEVVAKIGGSVTGTETHSRGTVN